MKKQICILHDQSSTPAWVRALPYAVATLGLDEADDLADLGRDGVVIDVDLGNKRRVESLRQALADRGGGPRLFVVDRDDRRARVQAGVLGVTDFVWRPVSPDRIAALIDRALGRARFEGELGRGVVPVTAPGGSSILAADAALGALFSACLTEGTLDGDTVRSASSEVAGTIRDIGLEPWMNTVRAHHGGTYQHCLLVTGIAVGFGTVLAMSGRDIERLAMAGLTHDVGKAQIPVHLLDKPGRLAADEFDLMKRHPEYGHDFLTRTDPSIDPAILDAVVHHHEMLDGSGYPHGLAGHQIADLTRIMTVCDIYGALAEKRAYKPPMTSPEILVVLDGLAEAGKLERALVRAFARVLAEEAGAARAPAPRLRRAG